MSLYTSDVTTNFNVTPEPETVTSNTTSSASSQPTIWWFVLLGLGALVIVVNAVTIVVVVQCRTLLQVSVRYGAVSLGMADMMTGLSILLMRSSGPGSSPGHLFCQLQSMFVFTSLIASCLTLDLLSLERCIASIQPARFRIWVTQGRKRAALVIVWIISLASGAATFYDDPDDLRTKIECLLVSHASQHLVTLWVAVTFLSFMVIFIAYGIIIAQFFQRKRQIRDVSSAPTSALGLSPADRKTVRIVGVLVGLAVVGYVPSASCAALMLSSGLYDRNGQYQAAFLLTSFLTLGNALLNPFVYFWQVYRGRVLCCSAENTVP